MPRSVLYYLLLIVSAVAMPMLAGCGGAGNGAVDTADAQPPAIAPQINTWLPAPAELAAEVEPRQTAYSEVDLIKHGRYYYEPVSQRAEAAGDSVWLQPTWGNTHGRQMDNMAYAMFVFYVDNYQHSNHVCYGWEDPPSDLSTVWLGVAHAGAETWYWYPCSADGQTAVSNLSFFFDDDVLFVIFVIASEEQSKLRYVRLGEPTVEAHIHTSPVIGFTPFTAEFDGSGSTTAVGTIDGYEWDLDDNGFFEENTGATPTVEHTFTETGRHDVSVRVTNSYGVTDTTQMTVHVTDEWTHSWGGSLEQQIDGVASDADFNVYGAGYTDTADNGADVLLLKWDLLGNLVWAKAWGGYSMDSADDIVVSGDKIYVAGSTRSFGAGDLDILVMCWDTDGNLEWVRSWGGAALDSAEALCIYGDALYIAGCTTSFEHINPDALMLKYSTGGNLEWARSVGGDYSDYALGIKAFRGFSSLYTAVHVCGSTVSFSQASSGEDLLYLRLTTAGVGEDLRVWRNGDNTSGSAISVVGLFGEEVHIAGDSNGRMLLVEVGDGSDPPAWAWWHGIFSECHDMVRIADSFYLCGETEDTGVLADGHILRVSSEGATELSRGYGHPASSDWIDAISGYASGGILLGGTTPAADQAVWSNTSMSSAAQSGLWIEPTPGIMGEPAGSTGSPVGTVKDLTAQGVIDAGGGDVYDALMGVYRVE